MLLSRSWLNEFVDLSEVNDHDFSEAMTLSGSKVETVERLDAGIRGVVVGKILEMRRHYSQYFKALPDFKTYRMKLVTSMDVDEIFGLLDEIEATYGGGF